MGILVKTSYLLRKNDFERISKNDELRKKEMYRSLESAKGRQKKVMVKIERIWKYMNDGRFSFHNLLVSMKKDVNAIKSIYGVLMSEYPNNPEVNSFFSFLFFSILILFLLNGNFFRF